MADRQQSLTYEGDIAREIVEVPVHEEMSDSFLAYSLSVITSRAIPDVRDGLKPVQRRILWAMLQLGMRPTAPFRKSAKVVGETMASYHPHGDAAIYDTLTRMGQPLMRNIAMVEPQGNFGTLDDPPAAARYTECRLTDAALDMVAELDEDTVDFRATYDGESEEPVVFPARLPHLLVNGVSGIAVGMATNMAPHNLREVEAAITLVMKKRRPKPTIDELLEALPGPDFPSGGIVVDDDLRAAYETGRGSFRIRAKAFVEQVTRNRQAIVVTELPYLVGPERVMAKLKELVTAEKVVGVDGFTNLTDMSGLRLQIDVKPGVNPQALLQELYRLTPLEETFGVNNVVLVDGVPTTIGLYDLCRHYIDHRLDVIVRRTEFRLERAESRLHILEGLLIALDAIDEVVAIIRSSQDAAEARTRLMERFELTEVQAAHILDMQLRRLTALARIDIDEEAAGLRTDIDGYQKLLASEDRRRTLVLKELHEVVEAHGTDRRAEIVAADDIPVYEPPAATTASVEEGDDEPCRITVSTSGNIGREPLDAAKKAAHGRHDLVAAEVSTSTATTVHAVTSEGRVMEFPGAVVADGAGRTRGGDAAQLLGLNKGESVRALVGADGDDGSTHLVIVTARGVAKRLTPDEVRGTKGGRTVISLKPGDEVVAAFVAADGDECVLVASDAQALRIPVDAISVQGRGAGGVAGMKLRDDARVVGAGRVVDGGRVVLATSDQAAKATAVDEIPAKGRATQGVRLTRLDKATVTVVDVGGPEPLLAQMSTDDDARKLEPTPVVFELDDTRRDLVPTRTDRQVLVLGRPRF